MGLDYCDVRARLRATVRSACAACVVLCALCAGGPLVAPHTAKAASAFSPRHSGLEAPGGPKAPEGLTTGQGASRTAEGGMGYADAYGNTLEDRAPAEKKPRKRPRPGAYGSYGGASDNRPLPDPQDDNAPPAWSFK